ncbi:MAG TPA: hypothetical protein VNP72_05195 [Longimicrobium sp.]|nr:hypothetical protein [Longimicrobium sp.]
MRRRTAARARAAAALAVLALAAACRPRSDTLHTLWRIPLPAEGAAGRTLGLDSLGRAWIGLPGGLVALDSTGRVAGRVSVRGDSIPRLLWQGPGVLALSTGSRGLARADAAGGEARGGWESRALRGAARDPRGRWVYAATRTGGVVGLDARTLAPRWGWPDAGAEATGIAVSTLADRVYVALGGDAEVMQVRDAQSGRVLFASPQGGSLRQVAAAMDGSVYGVLGGRVVKLRHARDHLETLWSVSPGTGGEGEMVLRVDAAGRRLAVFRPGGRLLVLEPVRGAVVGRTREAPRDAAFDVRGRLWLLESRAVRVVR